MRIRAYTAVKITCNNPNCFFTETFYHATPESIRSHRKFMSEIPCIDDECPHTDVTVTEIVN